MENDLLPPGLTYLADNILSAQNILGITKEQSARWAENLNLSVDGLRRLVRSAEQNQAGRFC